MHNMFKKILKAKRLDAILLLNTSLTRLDPNVNYVTKKAFEFCAVVIKKDGARLFVPELEYGRAKGIMKLGMIKGRDLRELARQLDIRGRIGVNYESITMYEHGRLRSLGTFVDISRELAAMRMQKTPAEMTLIRKAADHADEIFNRLFDAFRKKQLRTERDAAGFILDQIHDMKLKPSFKPIVTSGKNSANPHHDPTGSALRGFCLIDLGVIYNGYCSDMTRTVYFGKPTAKELEIYNLVHQAQEGSIGYVKAGMKGSQAHANCVRLLGKHGKYFIHGLGHGIGLEIHEGPALSRSSDDVIRDNMVFTIEPGIYIPGKFGIRIEDDIVLLPHGKKEVLTKTTKELLHF